VVVTSTEGQGSTFVLRLPVEGSQLDAPGQAGEASPERAEGVA
jgi:hypothetical protein